MAHPKYAQDVAFLGGLWVFASVGRVHVRANAQLCRRLTQNSLEGLDDLGEELLWSRRALHASPETKKRGAFSAFGVRAELRLTRPAHSVSDRRRDGLQILWTLWMNGRAHSAIGARASGESILASA